MLCDEWRRWRIDGVFDRPKEPERVTHVYAVGLASNTSPFYEGTAKKSYT